MKELLKQIKEAIGTPDKWTKGEDARDQNNKPCRYNSPKAVRWCISGIVAKFKAEFLIYKYLEQACNGNPVEFNDHKDHKDVMRLFDKAIRLAE